MEGDDSEWCRCCRAWALGRGEKSKTLLCPLFQISSGASSSYPSLSPWVLRRMNLFSSSNHDTCHLLLLSPRPCSLWTVSFSPFLTSFQKTFIYVFPRDSYMQFSQPSCFCSLDKIVWLPGYPKGEWLMPGKSLQNSRSPTSPNLCQMLRSQGFGFAAYKKTCYKLLYNNKVKKSG